jgi:hypothetical protein
MSRKHFSLLLVLTLAVAVLVLLIPGKTGKESEFDQSPLLPGLQAQVNDLDRLQVSGAGGETIATLRRSEGAWRVEEAAGYRADWERLRKLLADLAQAEIVEPKTSNPEYYDRLGVEDVSLPDAGGRQIGFPEGSGLPAVIVGNRAQGRSGQYVRLAGAAGSALIDRELDVPESASDWLEKDIVDIADSEVVEVDIAHPDGERIVARKASADDEDFSLQNIPEGREIRSAWTVNSLANSLSALTLDSVAEESAVDWSDAVRFGLVTADGLRVDVDLVVRVQDQDEDSEADRTDAGAETEHWIRLQAGLYQTAVDSAVETPGESGEDQDMDAAGEQGEAQGADDETTADDSEGRARAINERVSGWAYRIPKYKFDAMNKRMEDLLQAVEEPDA